MHSFDGLVAEGLLPTAKNMLTGFRNGIFPWYDERTLPLWWSPLERCVLVSGQLYLSRRNKRYLRALLRQGYSLRTDTAFAEVVDGCARPAAGREQTWILPEMREAYVELHRQGHAHSVQVHDAAGNLVGGAFGVQAGRVFVAESMFRTASQASKLALVSLAGLTHELGFACIDAQFMTPHLLSLRFCLISRLHYLRILKVPATTEDLPRSWPQAGDLPAPALLQL